PYPMLTPQPGWVEQTPQDWWTATCAALREARALIPAIELVGVGLSGQLNGFVLLDENEEPLGNAIIWLDTRATAEADLLRERFGAVLRERAATELNAITQLTKLAWLVRHEPERLAKARSVLLVKDYILWRLTGVRRTEPSDASATGLMDIETLTWIEELCWGAGFDPGLLPPIGASTVVAGHVNAEAAAATGLPAGTPVAPGGGDVAALAVGFAAMALPAGAQDKGTVGIAMPTKSSLRWISDGNELVKALEAKGYKADLQYAEDDIPNQLAQIENMVTKDV
ncbi:FGGY family carbohydrate kinase, partial [Rhizobiaceae sp. 2RAB30]